MPRYTNGQMLDTTFAHFPLDKAGMRGYKDIVLVKRFASRSRTAKRRVNRTTPTQGKSSSVADVAGRFSRVIWPFFGK
jgi:hypothetical protein